MSRFNKLVEVGFPTHLNDLMRIDRDEARDTAQMIEAWAYSRAVREKPRRDFARATDRRSGLERRSRA